MNIVIFLLFILVDNSLVNHKHTVTYTPSIIPYYILVSLWFCQFGKWTSPISGGKEFNWVRGRCRKWVKAL